MDWLINFLSLPMLLPKLPKIEYIYANSTENSPLRNLVVSTFFANRKMISDVLTKDRENFVRIAEFTFDLSKALS